MNPSPSPTRSTTAEGAAFCRALGARETNPDLRNPDRLAHHFVTRLRWRIGLLPGVRALARREVERQVPGAYLLHQVRTRVLDELALDAPAGGASQIVILGAGGDSRAYRFEQELTHLRVFEVDHPVTGAWKQQCVRSMLGRLPSHVKYVPLDFAKDRLASALAQVGFDADARTFFLWEGVTMYLRANAVDDVLALVANLPAGSSIALDYLCADAIVHPDRYEGAAASAAFAASRGEPYTFGLDPRPEALGAFFRARGLDLVCSHDHQELRAFYPGPGMLAPYVGVVHARVGPARAT